MPELTGREIAALITAFVGIGSLIFSIFRFRGERSDGRDNSSFDSRKDIREFYQQTAVEIMHRVGSIMSPRTVEEFKDDWYALERLHSGPARLLPNPSAKNMSISVDFDAFMESMWGSWDYICRQTDGDMGHLPKRWGRLNEASARLSTSLQQMLNEQFHIESIAAVSSAAAKEEAIKAKDSG